MGKELLLNAVHAAGYSMAQMEDANAFSELRRRPEDLVRSYPTKKPDDGSPADSWSRWLSNWFVRDPR